jgi:hypothetical protein
MDTTTTTRSPVRARAIETEALPQLLRTLRDVIAVDAITAMRSAARAVIVGAPAHVDDYDGRVRRAGLGRHDRLPGQLRA